MKKTGFTLAEVLITLAIIGVVATLTLPALMTNAGEQQAKTALKKGINTLTEAAKTNSAIDGWGFDGATVKSNVKNHLKPTTTANADAQCLLNLIRKRADIDYDATGTKANQGKTAGAAYTGVTIVLRDGTSIMFPLDTSVADETTGKMQDDGLPLGYPIIYDTNGLKGPNALSNCKGLAVAQKFGATETADETDVAKCSDAKNRVIKDQFEVQLRGTIAQPRGAAATWAYKN